MIKTLSKHISPNSCNVLFKITINWSLFRKVAACRIRATSPKSIRWSSIEKLQLNRRMEEIHNLAETEWKCWRLYLAMHNRYTQPLTTHHGRACVVTTIFIEIFAVKAQRDEFHSICQMNADIHVNVIQYLCVEIVVSQTKDECRETKRNRNKTKTNSLIENYFFFAGSRALQQKYTYI